MRARRFRDRGPFQSVFQKFVGSRRLELKMSQAELARKIGGSSAEFISMLEAGLRRIELDRVPVLAQALQEDPKSLCELALQVYAPEVFRTLFGDRYTPTPKPAPPEQMAEVPPEAADLWGRLKVLDPDLRGAIDLLVRALYAGHLAETRLPPPRD